MSRQIHSVVCAGFTREKRRSDNPVTHADLRLAYGMHLWSIEMDKETTMTKTTKAFDAGYEDGSEWVRDSIRGERQDGEEFTAEDVERGLTSGYSAEWRGEECTAALNEYNAGFAAGARAEIA